MVIHSIAFSLAFRFAPVLLFVSLFQLPTQISSYITSGAISNIVFSFHLINDHSYNIVLACIFVCVLPCVLPSGDRGSVVIALAL